MRDGHGPVAVVIWKKREREIDSIPGADRRIASGRACAIRPSGRRTPPMTAAAVVAAAESALAPV